MRCEDHLGCLSLIDGRIFRIRRRANVEISYPHYQLVENTIVYRRAHMWCMIGEPEGIRHHSHIPRDQLCPRLRGKDAARCPRGWMEAGRLIIVCLLVVQYAKMLDPLLPRSVPLKMVWVEIADISNTSFNGDRVMVNKPTVFPDWTWGICGGLDQVTCTRSLPICVRVDKRVSGRGPSTTPYQNHVTPPGCPYPSYQTT